MNHTEHYNLSQFEKSDRIQMEDFNADNAAIDAALHAHDTAINSKANSATVGALTTRVSALESGKADAEAFHALEASVAALATDLGTSGKNVRMVTGSYTGSGAYGASNPNSLSFDFTPVVVLISSDAAHSSLGPSFLIRPFTQGTGQNGAKLTVTWGDQSVSWYNKESSGFQTIGQNNTKNLYHYIALGYDA